MPEPFAQVINQTLARVRDQGGALHSHELCQDLLTRLQRLYNNQTRLVVSDITLTTQPMLQLYSFDEALNNQGITILKVTHENLPLERMTFSQLRALDPRWPRATGQRLLGYIQLGYAYVILWPALLDVSSVIITATTLTSDLASLDPIGELEIPSDDTPKLAQWLEALLLLRQRDMLSFETLMQQLAPQRAPQRGT